MIVFDLKCGSGGHVFEAWFASSGDWEDQRARGLIECPLCGDTDIGKALMAPNVAAKGNRGSELMPVAKSAPDDAKAKAVLGALAKVQASALENSTWVGDRFDSEARAMELGDLPRQTIHGEVTRDQAKALIEDGVGVMPLPFPVIPPEKRN